MKYGDTLPQRSIPEWAAYNVDYNAIKRLIKARTTNGEARAISIPGKENDGKALKELETELYAELFDQHQRIDLFVQSKSGEIKRRLNHLLQQVLQLNRRTNPGEQSRTSIRRLERYSRIEETILKAGEDIQSLSRFVGVQRLAFQKLLKKYKKWTGSQALGEKVEREILGGHSSFSHRTLEPLLAAWTNALVSVRAPFTAGGTWEIDRESKGGSVASTPHVPDEPNCLPGGETGQNNTAPVKLSSSVAQLHDAAEMGTDLDLDAALATVPLGPAAGTAAYWVHLDNILELQVLLMQHMRLQSRSKDIRSSVGPASSSRSGETSASGHRDTRSSRTEDDIRVTVLDNIEDFTKRQSGVVMGEKSLQNAAASIRQSGSSEAIILVRASEGYTSPADSSTSRSFQTAKTKRKHLGSFLDPCASRTSSYEPTQEVTAGTSKLRLYSAPELEHIREWFARHPEVQPLVDLQYRRTHFIGVGNNTTHGCWATLDREIRIKAASSKELEASINVSSPDNCDNERTDSVHFPHAVLEIRWEEGKGDNLAQALDKSHLVKRVQGFSLEAHAIAVIYKSTFTPPPFWFAMLGKDIRTVPASAGLPRRRHSTHQSCPGSASTEQTSTSTNATAYDPSSTGFSSPAVDTSSTSVADVLESSPLKPATNKGRKHRDHPLRGQTTHSPQSQHSRYWNEFDDGDEPSDPDAYTILINPHTSRSLPGTAGVSKLASIIASHLPFSTSTVREWLQPHRSASHNARDPPRSKHASPDPEPLCSTIDDDDAFPRSQPYTQCTYSTFPTFDCPDSQTVQPRDTLLLRLSMASFAFAFTTLFVTAALAFSARRKAHLPADVGILVGVIAALTSAVTGLTLMFSREVSLGWVWRVMLLLGFLGVCGSAGKLLAVVGSV